MTSLRRYLFIDSTERTFGTSGNFRISLKDAISDLADIRLESACIPYSFYNVNTNTSLTFQEEPSPGTFTVPLTIYFPPGNYTPTSLATAVASTMTSNSASGFTYTCAYNTSTLKYTISSTGKFAIFWTTNYIDSGETSYLWYYLGFNNSSSTTAPDPDTGFATSFTSSGAGSLLINQYIWLRILPALPNIWNNSSVRSLFCALPLYGNFGDRCYWQTNSGYDNQIIMPFRGTNLKDIQFQITGTDGETLDLNGVMCTFTFSYTVHQD